MGFAHNYKMGKRTGRSLAKRMKRVEVSAIKKTNQKSKHQRILHPITNQTSPKSKTQDTAIYYQESEDLHSLASVASEIKKTKALHFLSAVQYPSRFRLRQRQLSQINHFVHECLNQQRKGCRFLMLTGAPGLGKTLTVTTVLQTIDCMIIPLNSNVNKNLKDVQNIIYEKVMGRKSPKNLNTAQMIREFVSMNRVQPIIVYIQQIQTSLSGFQNSQALEFLSLFSKKQLNICLIGVSNSIDALQKYSEKVFSLYQVTKIIFAPYGHQQIGNIIMDRLEQLRQEYNVNIEICEKLLKYMTKKLENLTKGDIRIVNQFIKELAEKVFSEKQLEQITQVNSQQMLQFNVDIIAIEKVFGKMENSKDDLIKSLPFIQQLLLININAILEKQDLLFVTEEQIFTSMTLSCGDIKLKSSKSMIKGWLRQIECYSLIKIEERKDKETRIMLCVNSKQIKSCAQNNKNPINRFIKKEED